jgi:hypothetical protein
MGRSKLLVVVMAGALALSTVQAHAACVPIHSGAIKVPTWIKAAAVFTAVCATSIVGAALVKNAQQNKPLSANEATSCGWKFWVK